MQSSLTLRLLSVTHAGEGGDKKTKKDVWD